MRPKPAPGSVTPFLHAAVLAMAALLALPGCGGVNSARLEGHTGTVDVSLADASPAAGDNAWITVREIWFNTNPSAVFSETGGEWRKFPLTPAVTVNLASDVGPDNVLRLWDNLVLPSGTYRRILLFLESTESSLDNAARDRGLLFNNQVERGTLRAPLRVPAADRGIRVDGSFTVNDNVLTRLAIAFDIRRDAVPFDRGGRPEFILKPLLSVFDLGKSGAIAGYIDNTAARDDGALFVVAAEQADASLGARAVRRTAGVDNDTGRFVLYPLAAGSYDVVIRGNGWRTTVVNAVPVTAGSTPTSGATPFRTAASPLALTAGADYRVDLEIQATPTGAWTRIYQALPADTVPFEIRFRHLNPLTGIADNVLLSADPLRAGTYSGNNISLTDVIPTFGNGFFTAVAEGLSYQRFPSPSASPNVSPSLADTTVTLASLAPASPALSNFVTGLVTVPLVAGSLDNLFVFAARDGLIVNAQPMGAVTGGTQPVYIVGNLPGGSTSSPFTQGLYAVSAYGWSDSTSDNVLRIGNSTPAFANLQQGSPTVNVTMGLNPGP